MANPLFAPRRRTADPAPEAAEETASPPGSLRFVDPAEAAFSILVPIGWRAEGRLVTAGRNRYIVLDIAGPGDALVFHGDPDLPQRYVVPGPWHGPIQSGQRLAMNDGQSLYPLPLMNAPQMCERLAGMRFGPIAILSVQQDMAMIQAYRDSAARQGMHPPFTDACTMEFASADGARRGLISLVVFGGGTSGETWQVENITGYWARAQAVEDVRRAYVAIRESLDVSGEWKRENPDEMPKGFLEKQVQARRRMDEKDIADIRRFDAAVTGIRRSALGFIKSRRGAWPEGGWTVGTPYNAPGGGAGAPPPSGTGREFTIGKPPGSSS